MAAKTKAMRRFYLVQRLSLTPLAGQPAPANPKGVAALGRNPFGYGNLGDYDLEYMGSAEFEWGAIPEALERLQKAGKGLEHGTYNYGGHELEFLWIKKEGEPFEEFATWVEGRPWCDDYGYQCTRRPFDGKEMPHELRQRLNGETPWDKERGWQTALYWSLDDNVLFGFAAEGHIERLIKSASTAKNVVRG